MRECLIFWEKARIPTRATPHCVDKIMKMYNYWRNLQKSACCRSETQEENERNFISDLNNLFDTARGNALEIIKIEEDGKFLLSQREPGRRGCLMGIDMKVAKREVRVLLRVIEQENRRVKAHHNSEIDDNFMDSSEESLGTEDISDQPGPSSNIAQSSLEENINALKELRMGIVHGSKCFLTPKIMAVLDRFHISQRSADFILEAIAESLGYNIDESAINRNTIQRYREDFRKTEATRIKELFKENEPSFICDMDNKLLPALNVRGLKSERLPIIVAYKDEEKLLGLPKLENSSGKEQAMAVWNVLKDWGLEDKAQILCSDTTSSNTGRINGAITFLELYADREMTYFPCRHHIYELVLRSVFEYELNEVTSSPDVAFFKKIREKWNNMEKENYMDGYKYLNAICSESEILSNVNYLSNALKNKKLKNDYMELVELCIVFIGRNSDSTIKIRPPGALHHARWMAKAIYSFKIFLFRQQLSLKMSEVNGLKNICLFLVTVYVKSWLESSSAIGAALNDLMFLKKLKKYESINQGFSSIALKKFCNHLWY
ncbi:hypothetical protein AVEN_55006-1 [Araneus ventricosus]|uniref:Uncharacterized protein n=1 Tax=Araneus ventricosus TaxID=182803 RepID=A0A4Y2JYW1_ARAVE|nr:hypothetical protein AVEN_55006-1 [Araneus ventricosus]